ncbi:hypothetical protein M0805_006945 [Coniferiporia weirii]|nr:hypothetical protein M0805_006945 [Coniferiporia weirii]
MRHYSKNGETKEVREPTAPATEEGPDGLSRPPPSYDHAVTAAYVTGAGPSSPSSLPQEVPAPTPAPAAAAATSGETQLQYQYPSTSHAELPPDHLLETICPAGPGGHFYTKRFGLAGIITAVLLFPFGIILCMLDRRVVCVRCGQATESGITC